MRFDNPEEFFGFMGILEGCKLCEKEECQDWCREFVVQEVQDLCDSLIEKGRKSATA